MWLGGLAGKVDKSRLLQWRYLHRRVRCEQQSMQSILQVVTDCWKVAYLTLF